MSETTVPQAGSFIKNKKVPSRTMFVRDGVRSAGRFPVSSEGRERPLVRRRGGPTQDAVDVLEDLEVVVVGLVRLDVAVGQDIRHVERRDRIHPLVLYHQPPIDGHTP